MLVSLERCSANSGVVSETLLIPGQEAKEVPRPFLQDHGMDQPLEISERRESIIITFHGRTAATLPGTD